MKRSILTVVTITCIAGALVTSCNTPSQKVEEEKNNVAEANKDLEKANLEYLADMENCRKETREKIAANDQSIAGLREKIKSQKNEAKKNSEKKLAELEQRNKEIKMRIDTLQAEGKEKWEKFKTELYRDMEEVDKTIKDFASKNMK